MDLGVSGRTVVVCASSQGLGRAGADAESIRSGRRDTIPARRFGDPAEFGAAWAFLCSAQVGYITGQSLRIDGGVPWGAMK